MANSAWNAQNAGTMCEAPGFMRPCHPKPLPSHWNQAWNLYVSMLNLVFTSTVCWLFNQHLPQKIWATCDFGSRPPWVPWNFRISGMALSPWECSVAQPLPLEDVLTQSTVVGDGCEMKRLLLKLGANNTQMLHGMGRELPSHFLLNVGHFSPKSCREILHTGIAHLGYDKCENCF